MPTAQRRSCVERDEKTEKSEGIAGGGFKTPDALQFHRQLGCQLPVGTYNEPFGRGTKCKPKAINVQFPHIPYRQVNSKNGLLTDTTH